MESLIIHDGDPVLFLARRAHCNWLKNAGCERENLHPREEIGRRRARIEALLRSSGLRVKARPGHEMYLCEPDPQADEKRRSYIPQLASVVGLIHAK